MAATVTTPHRPFDRLWQPGHPFRPRRSKGRRWTMSLLLIFMSAVISSYWYLTDPVRIKAMSRVYLSELTGGPVEVGSASLTILEGLKLSNVVVKVDDSNLPDKVLLVTNEIDIQYNPSSLLRGKLQATRIICTGARVKLVEDRADGRWNFQRMKLKHSGAVADTAVPQMPQVVLRDAQVEYNELSKNELILRGKMIIEGQAIPSRDNSRIRFDMRSRGEIDGPPGVRGQQPAKQTFAGPSASGEVMLHSGQVTANLTGLTFGKGMEVMLPREVQEFWVAHKFEGVLNIPEFNYSPGSSGHRAVFHVVTKLDDVNLIVRARELDNANKTIDPILPPTGNKMLDRLSAAVEKVRSTVRESHMLPEQPPMVVTSVSGQFIFDENGIGLDHVRGTFAGAVVEVNGKFNGYSSDASVRVRIESPSPITLPADPDFLPSLPVPARIAFLMLHPQGTGTFHIDVQRDTPGKPPQITGELRVLDGGCDSAFFPYPARGISGLITFFPDRNQPFERVELHDLHVHGLVGGPNENNDIHAEGWLGGDSPDYGCHLHFKSDTVSAEPALFQALPPPVRRAMKIFKGPNGDPYLHGVSGFDCDVVVPPGKGKVHPIVSVDLKIADGSGCLTAFPYPMEHLHGNVHIGDGFVTIHDVNLMHGRAAVNVNGKVTWPANMPDDVDVVATPDIHLMARNVPVDEELLNVLPPDARTWMHAMGIAGTIDVDGPIVLQPTQSNPGAIGFHLGVILRDGKLQPLHRDFAVSDAGGKMVVNTDRVQVTELHGRRGDADLRGSGVVDWSGAKPRIKVNAGLSNLALDEPLRKLLPDPARQAWAAVDPHGAIDADLFYDGVVPKLAAEQSDAASTQPDASAAEPEDTHDFKITVRPRDLSVKAQSVPYKLEHCTGSIAIDPSNVIISEFGGQHGRATVLVSGKGLTATPGDWDLSLKSRDVAVDADLIAAVPPAIRQLIADLKFKGTVGLELKSMRYRGSHRADTEPDIDFTGTLHANDAALNIGMSLKNLSGDLGVNAAVRRGKMVAFHGDVGFDTVSFADRPVRGFKATLDMPAGSDTLKIGGIQGQIAGGDIAGEVKLGLPEQGPSTYVMDFAVKNADLREIAKQVAPKGQEIRGQVSASLALQGEWADPKTRRGRGDVLISGKEMYQIPLLLGLMEVTNLSLPTTSPFNEGTARYLVEGPRITFEQVQMRSDQLVMSGNGWLDFDTKKVRMNFTTHNPQIPHVPIIGDLVAGARQELLQIQVRGTVQNPTVSAASMHTFTTTVDEVFSGGQNK